MVLIQHRLPRSFTRAFSVLTARRAQLPPLNRPGPPPLPAEDQREFEELIKKAAHPAQQSGATAPGTPDEMHPDARRPPAPEFAGDVNPATGEKGGPKREPVRPNSDWSFNGRVTDF